MKPVQAILSNMVGAQPVFSTREIVQPFFSTEFHFHRECQLVYVVESSGQRIVGDSIEYFGHGELVFLGSDVPHVWHNDKRYFQGSGNLHAHSLALYFDPVRLIELMGAFVENHEIERWLNESRRGIVFTGASRTIITAQFKELFQKEGLAKITAFFDLLEKMVHARECRFLSSPDYENRYSENDQNRMDKLFRHIFTHFKREIPLKEVAALANMNEFSFCRYFKSRTQKPFTVFVNDLRIAHACRLIQERSGTIDQLAYECGFNNVTHFNRLFKRTKGMTPKEYRKQLSLYS